MPSVLENKMAIQYRTSTRKVRMLATDIDFSVKRQ